MIITFFDKGGMSIATVIQDLVHGDIYNYVHLSLHLELFLLCNYSFRQVQDSVELGWQPWVKEKCILICAAVKNINEC